MTRTRLRDRILPHYTRCEEWINSISHIVGGGIGCLVIIYCLISSIIQANGWKIVSSVIYGISFVALYTISSVYHGIRAGMAKKVMQVLDHCTIYFFIAGTYTPVMLCSMRPVYPGWAWSILGVVWGLTVLATTLTAIDLKKFSKLSMACYIGMGWSILLAAKTAIEAIPLPGLLLLLGGGIAYTVGACIYGIGKKKKLRYMHSVFHLFVLLGSLLQFFCILFFVI